MYISKLKEKHIYIGKDYCNGTTELRKEPWRKLKSEGRGKKLLFKIICHLLPLEEMIRIKLAANSIGPVLSLQERTEITPETNNFEHFHVIHLWI